MNETRTKVWVIDDDRSIRWVLEQAFEQAGMEPTSFASGSAAIEALGDSTPDVVVTDIRMPDIDGLAVLERLREVHEDLPVIVITAHSDLDSAVAAYRGGAFEYLPKPFDVDEAVSLVERAARNRDGTPPAETGSLPALIGQAPAMQAVFRSIGRLAGSSMNVLVTGESGTGKELVARSLHDNSPRSGGPFVALNVSAIPGELLESELFGHEKGSFTGAEVRRMGRFEQADGGTLFLDEIGDMPAALQTRLLRVLAEGEFYRVGGKDPIRTDVRVIAATHHDLARRVANDTFREDLFHRLNVIHIEVPPLRDRHEDIGLLLEHYLAAAAAELTVPPKSLSEDARLILTRFDWPGNVRQLVNACRRLTALAPGGQIQAGDIPAELGGQRGLPAADDWAGRLAAWAQERLNAGETGLAATAQPAFERALIEAALAAAGGKRQKAAELLGWGRNTLSRKIRELGLD